MTWLLLLPVALAAGMAAPTQFAINSQLRQVVGGPVLAAALSFLVGTVILFATTAVVRRSVPELGPIMNAPWWMWLGGVRLDRPDPPPGGRDDGRLVPRGASDRVHCHRPFRPAGRHRATSEHTPPSGGPAHHSWGRPGPEVLSLQRGSKPHCKLVSF